MKKTSYANWLLLLAIMSLAITQNVSFAKLTGEDRSMFLNSAIPSCYETQRSMSVNRDISNSLLLKYCECTFEIVADTLTATYLKEFGVGNIPPNKIVPVINIASNHCIKKVFNIR